MIIIQPCFGVYEQKNVCLQHNEHTDGQMVGEARRGFNKFPWTFFFSFFCYEIPSPLESIVTDIKSETDHTDVAFQLHRLFQELRKLFSATPPPPSLPPLQKKISVLQVEFQSVVQSMNQQGGICCSESQWLANHESQFGHNFIGRSCWHWCQYSETRDACWKLCRWIVTVV